MKKIIVGMILSFLLLGCATIIEGTDQTISIIATPAETICVAERKGKIIGSTSKENNILSISKSRNDIILRCSAPGFIGQNVTISSEASGWGVTSIFAFDLGLTDWATGAINEYPDSVTINLRPE